MNKTVELVNEWAAYEAAHTDASIADFCRYYLTTQRAKLSTTENFAGSGVPPQPAAYLTKLIGYIARAFQVYVEKAMVDLPEVRQAEDFYFLNNIYHAGEIRKTEVTHIQLMGISTGIDTINRLLQQGLVEERVDPVDKRARLVKITDKGRDVLFHCYQRAGLANEILFKNVREEDLNLCIQLLRNVELEHSALLLEMRDQPIEVIYEKVTGRKLDLRSLKPHIPKQTGGKP